MRTWRTHISSYGALLWITFLSLVACFALAASAQSQSKDWRKGATHMRLVHDLDRPKDGWCLDVVGSGPHIRFDMPLIGHNCKPGLYADEAVIFRTDGTLYFPAYDGCVTVMGLNEKALPGAALMLKKCGENSAFLTATNFQKFNHRENGQIAMDNSDLCITVGDQSHSTFDITHAWRTLFVARCDQADNKRSHWRFVRPLKN